MSEEKALKVLLFGATFNTQNMGVGALASGSIRCLTTQEHKVSISLLDYGTEETVQTFDELGASVSLPVVAMRFSKKLYLPNNIAVLLALAIVVRLLPTVKMRQRVIARNRCLSQICAADLIAAISGGDSFSDIYGLERFFYVSLPMILAIVLRKKLILLPQTLGPFSGRLPRLIANWIMRRAERVYSRDHQGIKDLKSLLGTDYDMSRHSLCYDVGFVVEPRKPARAQLMGISSNAEGSSALVGLNISGLLLAGGYTHDNMFGLRTDYRGLIRSIVRNLIENKKVTVLLIPHVFGTEPGSESDVLACEEVFAELAGQYGDRLRIVRGEFDQCEIKYVIGQCDFFVGSRMHACIAALSQEIPAVTIAYSGKFVGVLNTIGVPSLVADARQLSEDQIMDVINTAFDGREIIRTYLSQKMPAVKKTILQVSNDVLGLPAKISRVQVDSVPEAALP